jgi:hypothetical protein
MLVNQRKEAQSNIQPNYYSEMEIHGNEIQVFDY